VQLEETQVFRRRRVGRPANKGRECADMSNVVAARLLAKAAHGHVLDHACPQWADGRMRSIRGHRGSSLELKVAGPSMLGVRRPDRHLLPRITPSTMRGPRRVLPPARAGSFIGAKPSLGRPPRMVSSPPIWAVRRG